MKYSFYHSLFFLIIIISSCSNYSKINQLNSYNSEGQKTGVWLNLYEDTETLKEINSYNKNIKSGKYYSYYKTGKIEIKGKFKNGQKEGKWYLYDNSGNILKESLYFHDSVISVINRNPPKW